MISLTFPDGAKRSFAAGVTGREVAASIAKSLEKKAVAMTVDGNLSDLADELHAAAQVVVTSRASGGAVLGSGALAVT